MAGKRILITTANEMTRLYASHVGNLPVPPGKKTQYVSFTFPDLMEYLNEVAPFTDELRIFLGVHPDNASEPGRVTTIIWPYKDGEPAARPMAEGKDGGGGGQGLPPYDEGNNNP